MDVLLNWHTGAGTTEMFPFFPPVPLLPVLHASHIFLRLSHLCQCSQSVRTFPSQTVPLFFPPAARRQGRRKTNVPVLNVKLFKRWVIRSRLLTLIHRISIKLYGNGSIAT